MARPEPRATFFAPMAPRGHHTPSDPTVWRQTNEYPSPGLPRGIDGRRISRCPEPFKVQATSFASDGRRGNEKPNPSSGPT